MELFSRRRRTKVTLSTFGFYSSIFWKNWSLFIQTSCHTDCKLRWQSIFNASLPAFLIYFRSFQPTIQFNVHLVSKNGIRSDYWSRVSCYNHSSGAHSFIRRDIPPGSRGHGFLWRGESRPPDCYWPDWAIYWKVFATNCKVAQIFSDYFGNFEDHQFKVKTAVATFGEIWATFYS